MESRRERARPMAPEDRREAIVCAARPLLIEHGRAATTKQIADAAGVAEGTIFRVFPTKEELVEAVLDAEADTGEFLEQLDRIDLDQPLRERLVDFVSLLQQRFIGIFALMTALAVPRPPQHTSTVEARRAAAEARALRLVLPDADTLRVAPEEVVRLLRLLTFSGSHPHVSEQRPLTPEEIVDVILGGTLRRPECGLAGHEVAP